LSCPSFSPLPETKYSIFSVTGLHFQHFGASLENSADGPKSPSWIQPLSATLGFEDFRWGFKAETFSRAFIKPVFDLR